MLQFSIKSIKELKKMVWIIIILAIFPSLIPNQEDKGTIKKEEAKIMYFINKQLKNLISNIVDDRRRS